MCLLLLLMPPASISERPQMTGFWHIGRGASSNDQSELVRAQLQEIMASPLFASQAFETSVRYLARTELADEVENLLSAAPGFEPIAPPTGVCASTECYELPTLSALHAYCQDETSASHFVFYIHTKANAQWRQSMQVRVRSAFLVFGAS